MFRRATCPRAAGEGSFNSRHGAAGRLRATAALRADPHALRREPRRHSGIVVEREELLKKRPGLGPHLGQARYVEIVLG